MHEAARLLHTVIGPNSLSEEQIFQLLERPKSDEHGDIAFPAFQLAKAERKAPPVVAADLATKLAAINLGNFQSVKNLGPYLNFRLGAAGAFAIAKEVEAKGEKFGHSALGSGQKVLVEYSSPNVAKELHIGHFRNTVLGQALFNIYKATGHDAVAINHLGDWGSQFGRVAWGFLRYGSEEEMKKNPLEYLTKLYVRVSQEEETNPEIGKEARLFFKKIEEKDPELTKLWKHFCELSIEGLKIVYARLGVKFDHYIGESFYVDKIPALIQDLKAKNLLETSEGAQVVSMGEDQPPCLMLTQDGTSLYATRDTAAAIWRHEHFKFDRCLYVVGNEQQLHFKQVFSVIQKLGYDWADRLQHVNYGLYRFKDGKFSTRKGKVVLLEEVLDEAREKAAAAIEAKNPSLAEKAEVAEKVGVGAVVFNDLSTDRAKDVEFDWDRILDFEGDTGPYLQYSYARAGSILRSAATKGFKVATPGNSETLKNSDSALKLMKQFGRLEISLEGAVRLNKPSIVANYALDLARSFSAFYRDVRVLDEKADPADVAERLGLVTAFRTVLGNTLQILCMRLPEEM
jgi:arginyl-tRNA synthetase